MKKYLFLITLTLLTQMVSAQDSTKNNYDRRTLCITPGITYQGLWTAELSFMYAKIEAGPCTYALGGWKLGAEFVFDKGTTVIAPKIGCQMSGMLLCLRASEINYLHQGKVDIRLLPEIGVDLILFDICYGYNIHVAGEKYRNITDHRVALTFNLRLIELGKKRK